METSTSELNPPTDERYQYEEEGDMTKSQIDQFLCVHLYTLWLFTTSDIQSVIIPQTLLGLSTALSGGLLPTPNPSTVLLRTPSIIIWNWMNLLLFDIDNQFQPGSITEDTLNKLWRAIPSQRLTAQQARHCLLLLIPTVFSATLYLGGTREAVTLMVMTRLYNDLHGADVSIATRNLLNAFGYMRYSSGSMRVASLNTNESTIAKYWLALISGVIFTPLQMQDMPDVRGNAARGRRTVPLVYGDCIARWSIGVPVMAWSFILPAFWGMDPPGYIPTVGASGVFIARLLMRRSSAADGDTWKLWCVWLTTLYLLPVCKAHVFPWTMALG